MTKAWLGALLLILVSACAPQGGAPAATDVGRFVVYFDEFSANLTPEALEVVAQAVQRAREIGASSVLVEAHASATGGSTANQYLTQTRAQVVADELAKKGLSAASIHQKPLGQTASGDPSVAERRVDIVLAR